MSKLANKILIKKQIFGHEAQGKKRRRKKGGGLDLERVGTAGAGPNPQLGGNVLPGLLVCALKHIK